MIIFIFVSIFYISKFRNSIYHTTFAGIGAYQNPYGIVGLNDKNVYKHYEKVTGTEILTDPVSGNRQNPELMKSYNLLIKRSVFDMFEMSPFIFIRNSFYNFSQIFSFGHAVDKDIINSFSVIIGIFTLSFLIYFKLYVYIVAVVIGNITYFPIYPPIPHYNFCSYLILTFCFIKIINKYISRYSR